MLKDIDDLNIVYYSATDCDRVTHRVTSAHTAGVLHQFGDILGRLPDDVRLKCESIQAAVLSEWKSAKGMLKGSEDHPPQISKEELDEKKVSLSDSYLAALCSELDKTEFNENAWCFKCERMCPISPRSCVDNDMYQGRWTEVGGHTCDPWTSQGSHSNFLDESTLPLLVWIFSSRYYEVDDLVDECTPQWKPAIVEFILGDAPARLALLKTGQVSSEVADQFSEDFIKPYREKSYPTYGPDFICDFLGFQILHIKQSGQSFWDSGAWAFKMLEWRQSNIRRLSNCPNSAAALWGGQGA